MSRIKLNILGPWQVLITLVTFVTFISVVALAKDDEVIGHTEHGIPVLESEIKKSAKAVGLRQLDINIKDIKKISTNVISEIGIELLIDDNEYSVIFGDCKLTEIDNFQFQTRGDGKLDVGDFAVVRRNPFKFFDNPNLELSKAQIESKLKDWDLDVRICTIVAISKIEIVIPKALEDVRG